MKIVILDGYAANPGDLSWEALAALGELTVYDRTAGEDILSRSQEAELLITNKTPLSREIIQKLQKLKYIGTVSTGYNVVDTAAAAERGIPVCNVPSYCTKAVAQFTFALLFELSNRVQLHSDSVRAGNWSRCRDFCYWEAPLTELEHKTMGIVGFGNIGRVVSQIAVLLGMQVLVYTRSKKVLPEGCVSADFDTLLSKSDVISLHCPLTEETAGLIGESALSRVKPTAFLINTARGPIVEEAALARALNEGRLAGAALDVLSKEPPAADNPLLAARNCIITPHIAWASFDSRVRLIETVTENVRAFLEGHPQNVVNA